MDSEALEQKRYFLKYSAAFDYPPFKYHTEKFKAAVKRGGGANVRESLEFEWSNQPKVVTWTGDEEGNRAIERELSVIPPYGGVGGLPSPIIFEKDW